MIITATVNSFNKYFLNNCHCLGTGRVAGDRRVSNRQQSQDESHILFLSPTTSLQGDHYYPCFIGEGTDVEESHLNKLINQN